jgi:predicted amidohydrolase YtcJ
VNSAIRVTLLALNLALIFNAAVLAQTADTIYHNGSILTMAGAEPTYVEALAVKDGKIAFAGSKSNALKMKGDVTKIVDLDGKTLLPGFIDGHSHYINSLLVADQCKLYAPPSGVGKDVPSIIAELKRYAAERKILKGEMIMGYGYDDTVMPGGRLLNRDDLDEAFPDNPVRIEHVSMHGVVLNSLALKYYDINAETETPAGGVIVRKPGTKEPWGLIMESRMQSMLDSGQVESFKQLAELGRISQPRMTQIMSLLLLAPDIQEELLHLPGIIRGKATIHEKLLRPLTTQIDWRDQRKIWKKIKSR